MKTSHWYHTTVTLKLFEPRFVCITHNPSQFEIFHLLFLVNTQLDSGMI